MFAKKIIRIFLAISMCFSTYAAVLEPASIDSTLSKNIKKQIEEQKQLYSLLKNQELSSESRYSIMKKIATNLLSVFT